MNDTVTFDGALARYQGRLVGRDSVRTLLNPVDGYAAVILVTDVIEVTETVPKWAIHPTEKVGKECTFDSKNIEQITN